MTGINMGSQKEAGIRGSEHGAALEPPSPFHRQQVPVIKCFFISSRATTKRQNRIKQSGGMLALLMLRPFENMLAMRGSGMLQARIREQRDGEIRSAVWEPSSSSSYLHTYTVTYEAASPPRDIGGLARVQGHHSSSRSEAHQRL